MNKKEAAEFLGISTRQIANYVSQGRLGVKYVQGKNGKEAVFEERELEEFKTKSQNALYRPAFEAATQEASEVKDFTPVHSSSLVPIPNLIPPAEGIQVFTRLADNIERAVIQREREHKPVLTLQEAEAEIGVSLSVLTKALNTGKLKGYKNTLGRGWRVKRSDLASFIELL